MSDDFKLSDLNHPLYEYSQVVTILELDALIQSLYIERLMVPWWNVIRKWAIDVAIGTMVGLLQWVLDGKHIKDKKGDLQ